MKRILVLHGLGQSGSEMSKKLGFLRTELRKVAELVFLDAPLEVSEHVADCDKMGVTSGRAWYRRVRRASDSTSGSTGQHEWIGHDDAFSYIANYINAEGPFHGILGFSQGAGLGGLFLMLARDLLRPECQEQLRFGIIVGGFVTECAQLQKRVDMLKNWKDTCLLPIATLNIFGENDQIIPPGRSLAFQEVLATKLGPATAAPHDGGHTVPSSCRKAIKAFVTMVTNEIADPSARM